MAQIMRKNLKYTFQIKGYAYVRNSEGTPGCLRFIVGSHIDISNNTAKMVYILEMFETNHKDYLFEEYNDYSTAVDRFNALSAKWDAK